MNNSKRNKIQAKLDHPSTPEPEKEVCRKILKENPKEDAERSPLDGLLHTIGGGGGSSAGQATGDFWQQARNQQQQAWSQQQAAQTAAQAQARQQTQQGYFYGALSGLFGGAFDGFSSILSPNLTKPCGQCGNNFFITTDKDLYCPICPAAKRKEAKK